MEDNTLEYKKLDLQQEKLNTDKETKGRELNLKKEDLNEKIRHNKEAEKISRIKKPSSNK